MLQQQPDGSVATLNLLDPADAVHRDQRQHVSSARPRGGLAETSVTDPDYAGKIVQFAQDQAPDTFAGEPVNFFQTFSTTVTAQLAFPDGNGPEGLLPLLNLEIWGTPTSRPAADPTNANFVYQRFQRGILHYDKACGCTQGLLLADYLKSVLTGLNLPPDLEGQAQSSKYYRQYAPGQPASLARAARCPGVT